MGVTLKQIAAELNVSQPLVTYALNGKPGVSPQMRQAIIETAERLGYNKYSNREARMLAARRHGRRVATGMIALIFPRYGDAPWAGDTPWTAVPYFRAMVDGVEYEAGLRGLDLVIAPYRHQDSLPRIVLERGVDGVIFLSPPSHQEIIEQMGMPVVSLGTECRTSYSFLPDDKAGIALAVDHLLDLGHRSIAYIGVQAEISSARARLDSYRNTLHEYGLPVDDSLIAQSWNANREDGAECLTRLLNSTASPDFTAVICHNDLMAMGAIEAASANGLRIPEDLSVVGFDDVSTEYNFQPAVTSVAFGRFDMGRRAVEVICDIMDAERQAENSRSVEMNATQASSAAAGTEAVSREQSEVDGPSAGLPPVVDSNHGSISNRIFPVTLSVRKSTGCPKYNNSQGVFKNTFEAPKGVGDSSAVAAAIR